MDYNNELINLYQFYQHDQFNHHHTPEIYIHYQHKQYHVLNIYQLGSRNQINYNHNIRDYN
ncbi:hypothetical protein EV177_003512 [Coemansia sp. RSA 1804]|nr:hypothetical protein EV177_003512 [Coemansia sp. RSA 1804]